LNVNNNNYSGATIVNGTYHIQAYVEENSHPSNTLSLIVNTDYFGGFEFTCSDNEGGIKTDDNGNAYVELYTYDNVATIAPSFYTNINQSYYS